MKRERARWLIGFAVAAVGMAGCEKPLLTDTEERSPFDRYDSVRNQYAEQWTMDAFGRRHPNIRERLGPKD